MFVKTAYRGHSGLTPPAAGTGSSVLRFAPDVDRDRVSFDADLAHPLRFREAMSTLHDVVISDLRFEKRDRTAYEAWKSDQAGREGAIRADAYRAAKEEFEARSGGGITPELEKLYKRAKGRYWKARRGLNQWLRRNDPALWRKLMPYDPVMTVADDTLFFECFSADESTYGCLSVERERGFREASRGPDGVGTTNVDYSWDLYDHFQSLRSYRPTRFSIDPDGFEVTTGEAPVYREDKIDLPDGWLRGFGQLQAAMGMPMRKVTLDVPTVYSLLAFLRRNKAKESPRAIRFELTNGAAPVLVLEPWEKSLPTGGPSYRGPEARGADAVRIWGRRRLLVLARALPLAESVDVYLLGSGLPSFWVVRMGDMHLTLGLSGWTTNDWSRGSAIDQLMPRVDVPDATVGQVAAQLQEKRSLTLENVASGASAPAAIAAAALGQLSLRGQAIFDLGHGVFRWRQILPMALSDKELGDSDSERAGAEEILRKGTARLESTTETKAGGVIMVATVAGKPCEVLVDEFGVITKGKCLCSHHHKFGLRNGPCRHLQALRDLHLGVRPEGSGESSPGASIKRWFDERLRWSQP